MTRQHPFERSLEVAEVEVVRQLFGVSEVPWADFWLNPRQLRGSDFLMRWAQGVWSENRMIEAVNGQGEFYCVPYGPSGVAPTENIRAFELYFEKLEAAGLGDLKRPDLLLFPSDERATVDTLVRDVGGEEELPFTPEGDERIQQLLHLAVLAVECENSLWKAMMMPKWGADMRPQKRLQGKLGFAKKAVLPTIILKEEDRGPLNAWQGASGVPIHVWHSFYDLAFGIALDRVGELVESGLIEATTHQYQAPGGATTTKVIYKIYYSYGYPLGAVGEEPQLLARSLTDKNGHILPYVHFDGGSLILDDRALNVVREIQAAQRKE